MSSKKKQPKCMDINNYFNLKKLNNSYINKQVHSYTISDINDDTLVDHLNLEQVNEYLNEMKKNNITELMNIRVEKRIFIDILPRDANPTYKYTNDIIKYIELFLFRKIKVMSIVNLIMKGKYFSNEFRHVNLTDLIQHLDNKYSWDYQRELEDYYENFDTFKPITGMCRNFNKLQFLEY